ncbi:MAG TPA: DinB family protein [Bacteroidota bacterium]|nr:DinB family protein [Bacteroidota bacterium]
MNRAQELVANLQRESHSTKKILERIPSAMLTWKPHEKSMSLGRLGMHIAELPRWMVRYLESTEYDFGTAPYKPVIPESHAQIMDEFTAALANAEAAISRASDTQLKVPWKALNKGQLIFEYPRWEMIQRGLHHIIHHRGQISVYLRLTGTPIPGMYGPSADER